MQNNPHSSVPLNSTPVDASPLLSFPSYNYQPTMMGSEQPARLVATGAGQSETNDPMAYSAPSNHVGQKASDMSFPSHGITPVMSEWDINDVTLLKDLLEAGEAVKWKFISAELTRERGKRITGTACQKRFREMFGVPEAASVLGSSLSYVVPPNGWACLESTRPLSASAMQSIYSDHEYY